MRAMWAGRVTGSVAVVVLAASLAACGPATSDSGRGRDLSGAERIVAGYDEARATRSVRMDGEISVRSGSRDATVPLEGAIDFSADAARFTASLEGLGLPALGDATLEARVVDGRLYLRLPGFAARFLGGATWAEVPIDALGGTSPDPTGFLDSLRGMTEVERVGTDTIRGVEATHYRGTVSLSDAIDRAPAARREQLRRTLGTTDASVPVDLWVDDRDRPVRFVATFAVAGVEAAVRLDLFDYGADVRVSAPPADQVTSLGGLLGGEDRDTTAPTANA